MYVRAYSYFSFSFLFFWGGGGLPGFGSNPLLNFLREELLANEHKIIKMSIFGRYDTVPLLLIAEVLLL